MGPKRENKRRDLPKGGGADDEGKKKKKKRKNAKLSEDEKRESKDKRSAQQEESRRRRDELAQRFLQDKLQAEWKFARLNEAKLTDKWRTLLRHAKSDELKGELVSASATFKRINDRRERSLTELLSQIQSLEEQLQMTSRSNLERMDRLIDRMDSISDDYTSRRDRALQIWTDRKTTLQEEQTEMLEHLKDIAFDTETHMKEMSEKVQKEYETRHQPSMQVHALRIQAEERLKALYKEYTQILRGHSDVTAEKWKTYTELIQRDVEAERQLQETFRQQEEKGRQIANLRSKLRELRKERECVEHELKQKNVVNVQAKKHRRRKEEEWKDLHNRRLKDLNFRMHDIMKDLETYKGDLQKALKVAGLCSKLETDSERYGEWLRASSHELLEDGQDETSTITGETAFEAIRPLDKFWSRYSSVVLQSLELSKHKEELSSDNATAKAILLEHFNSLTLTDTAVATDPILMPISHGPWNKHPPKELLTDRDPEGKPIGKKMPIRLNRLTSAVPQVPKIEAAHIAKTHLVELR